MSDQKQPSEHQWGSTPLLAGGAIPVCLTCGMVKVANGPQKPCRGKLPKITTR